MRIFKTLADVEITGLPPAVKNAVISCVRSLMDAYGEDFDADEVGGVVLLDWDTTDDDAYELFGRTWVEGLYEGVTYDEISRCYLTRVLFNNEEGVTIVVPDGPGLDVVFREVLEAGMVRGVGQRTQKLSLYSGHRQLMSDYWFCSES
jgi:hypothetical protein